MVSLDDRIDNALADWDELPWYRRWWAWVVSAW